MVENAYYFKKNAPATGDGAGHDAKK